MIKNFSFDKLIASVPYGVWVIPSLMVGLAVASVWQAGSAATDVAAVLSHRVVQKGGDSVTLSQDQITPDQALVYARKLTKMVPAMNVQVKGNVVIISAADPVRFAEFMAAMAFIQSSQGDLRWTAKEICLKSCSGGDAMRAVVSATKTKLSANG